MLGNAPVVPFLPPPINYANNAEVRRYVEQELCAVIEQTRAERQELEAVWHETRNMNSLRHDHGRRYFGRSDSYLPIYKKVRGTIVSGIAKGVFPTEDFMDIEDRETGNSEHCKPLKTYMMWELTDNAKVRRLIKPLIAELVDYGTAIGKVVWRKQLASRGGVVGRIPSVTASQGSPVYGFNYQRICDGMAFSHRSIFNVYVYPSFSESLEDAQLIFEDLTLPRSTVEMMLKLGRWTNPEAALSRLEVGQTDSNEQERRAARHMNMSPPTDVSQPLGYHRITESWTFMRLPRSAYLPWENTEFPIPVKVVTVGNVPLEVIRHPFLHQLPPYVCARLDWEQGMFYGQAIGHTMRPLQMLANDFMNQSSDCGTIAMNPYAIVDPGAMDGPPKPLRPGVVWFASRPKEAVVFDRPPHDHVQLGMQMVQMLVSFSQDFTPSPPFSLPGSSGSGRIAKTATGAQILQRNAQVPMQDVIEDMEIDCMVPMTEQGIMLAQQYRDEDVMVRVAGENVKIYRDQLAVNAKVRWLASSQAMNQQMRAQQVLQMIQVTAPVWQMLNQMGYVVDFAVPLRKLWNDGLGLRGFESFIYKAAAAPGVAPVGQPGAQGPLPPEQQNGVRREQGDRIRSTLEQVSGYGGAEPTPGEGDDFMSIRDQADDLASMFGGMR